MLFPALSPPAARATVRVGDRTLTFAELAAITSSLASTIEPGCRVVVIAERDLSTIVGVVAVLQAGAVAVPINASATAAELEHLIGDSNPALVLHGDGYAPGAAFDGVEHRVVSIAAPSGALAERPSPDTMLDPPLDDRPALVMYTSGTTGPPKGAVLSRAAVAANLDALAEAWRWTADDRLVHALPLYHVHGLVLGVLGPLRLGASLHHTGLFDASTTASALRDGGTMLFGVPTIYGRLADATATDASIGDALRGARLLVSGSAALGRAVHERITSCSGHVVVERYGMTETMITTAVPAGRRDKVGSVGPALRGVALRLVDDDGNDVPDDGVSMGEIWARTPSMFSGYLNRPDATAASFRDGWMVTGDIATRDAEGYVRIVGRRSSDIIKSGGFKIGAGEIEDCLLAHAGVAEAAVRGLPDDDLGERVVAWVVARPGASLTPDEVLAHASALLVTHKRPKVVHVVESLPRNGMGKVQKAQLREPDEPSASEPLT